jgi:polar amino acid transport system substrate-binding protein
MLFTVTGALATAPANRLEKIKADGKLIVATSPDYPPYEFLDLSGNPVGADIDLAKYIANKLGVELVLQPMTFDAVLAAIGTGSADLAIAGLTYKEERTVSMDFSDPYFDDGNQVIVIRKEDAETIKTLADFKGKSVAAQNASLQQTLVQDQLKETTLAQITQIDEGILLLKSKQADGIALASVVAIPLVANNPDLVICETPFDWAPAGALVAAVKGEKELLAAVNEVIAEVGGSDGLYVQWINNANALNAQLASGTTPAPEAAATPEVTATPEATATPKP